MTLSFFVPGPCVALARPRVVRKGSRVIAFTPSRSQAYKRHVALHALNARNRLEGWRLDWARYLVDLIVYRDEHGFDVDNAAKGLLDACQGVLFDNDTAVVSLSAEFVDCEEGLDVNGEPWPVGARVVVAMLGDEDVETAKRSRARRLRQVKRWQAEGAGR